MTLTEFLLARIDEDDAAAKVDLIRAQPRDLLAWPWSAARVMAECRTKRNAVIQYQSCTTQVPITDHEAAALGIAAEALKSVLLDFLVIYSDHRDYQDEWAA